VCETERRDSSSIITRRVLPSARQHSPCAAKYKKKIFSGFFVLFFVDEVDSSKETPTPPQTRQKNVFK
jgi:hypothetical protein